MMYLPRIAYFPRAWTVEECRDYITHYGGSYTPEMSLEELRVALLNKTEEHINGLVEESSDLVERYLRQCDAAEAAMHCLLHVDADMTERIAAAKAVAETIAYDWPPYEEEKED